MLVEQVDAVRPQAFQRSLDHLANVRGPAVETDHLVLLVDLEAELGADEHLVSKRLHAAAAMVAWLEASGIREGALFRRIRKGGHLGEPLAPAAVRDIVKERCALAGIGGSFLRTR